MPGPSTSLPRVERSRGSLLGQAVGDALGSPLEGLTAQQIATHYGRVMNYVDGRRAWRKRPFQWRLPGLYRDGTQQALAVSEVLLERDGLDAVRLRQLYLDLLHPRGSFYGAHRGVGRSFRRVLDRLDDPVARSSDDVAGDSAGISASARVVPAALYFGDAPERMGRAIVAASRITHRDIRSIAGAMAVGHATRRLLDGEEPSGGFLLRLAADVLREETALAEAASTLRLIRPDIHRHSVSMAIAALEGVIDRPRDQAFVAILEEANRVEDCADRPTKGYPPCLLPTCLYVLIHAESFEEALVEIINLGGDTDTAGTILGAWAGARFGVARLPDRWLGALKNREMIDSHAQALCQKSSDGLTWQDYAETERSLSRSEERYRDQLRGTSPGANSSPESGKNRSPRSRERPS